MDSKPSVKNKYSILLGRPDFMTDGDRTDTYLAHVRAASVRGAVNSAKRAAAKSDGVAYSSYAYNVLMVIKGYHNDIKGEA